MCDFPCGTSLCVKVVLVVCYFYVPVVPIYFVHVPALTWCIAVCVRMDIDSMMQSCVFAFLYIRVYYLSAHGTHEGEC